MYLFSYPHPLRVYYKFMTCFKKAQLVERCTGSAEFMSANFKPFPVFPFIKGHKWLKSDKRVDN